MTIKSKYFKYEKPIKIYYKIVAGETELDPINLSDIIFDDYDFIIRKMDPKTQQFVKYRSP